MELGTTGLIVIRLLFDEIEVGIGQGPTMLLIGGVALSSEGWAVAGRGVGGSEEIVRLSSLAGFAMASRRAVGQRTIGTATAEVGICESVLGCTVPVSLTHRVPPVLVRSWSGRLSER